MWRHPQRAWHPRCTCLLAFQKPSLDIVAVPCSPQKAAMCSGAFETDKTPCPCSSGGLCCPAGSARQRHPSAAPASRLDQAPPGRRSSSGLPGQVRQAIWDAGIHLATGAVCRAHAGVFGYSLQGLTFLYRSASCTGLPATPVRRDATSCRHSTPCTCRGICVLGER